MSETAMTISPNSAPLLPAPLVSSDSSTGSPDSGVQRSPYSADIRAGGDGIAHANCAEMSVNPAQSAPLAIVHSPLPILKRHPSAATPPPPPAMTAVSVPAVAATVVTQPTPAPLSTGTTNSSTVSSKEKSKRHHKSNSSSHHSRKSRSGATAAATTAASNSNTEMIGGRVRRIRVASSPPSPRTAGAASLAAAAQSSVPPLPIPTVPSVYNTAGSGNGGSADAKRAFAFHQNIVSANQPQLAVMSDDEHSATREGIMIVVSIVRTSPAEDAGLKCGDIITHFGSLSKLNFNSITQIVPVVKNNPGRILPITVLRKSKAAIVSLSASTGTTTTTGTSQYQKMSLSAVPARWSHGGVLGCVLNWWPIPTPVTSTSVPPTMAAPPFSHQLGQTQPQGAVTGSGNGQSGGTTPRHVRHQQNAAAAAAAAATGGKSAHAIPVARGGSKLPKQNNFGAFFPS